MARDSLPKNILVIKDCTFILPEDFEGTVEDAFEEFLKYRQTNLKDAKHVDPQHFFSSFNLLLCANNDQRVCGQYYLYKLNNEDKYEAIVSTDEEEGIKPIV